MSNSSAVRVAARVQPAKQALIFLHGLGDSGAGWSFFAQLLQRDAAFKHTKFIFPNAPIMNITVSGNMPMPAWFDIRSFDDLQSSQDQENFLKSIDVVKNLVQEEIQSGIDPQNIVVGGFSQGAALTLGSAALLPTKIGGFVALSGFPMIQNKLKTLQNHSNQSTPVFQGHGDQDGVVPLSMGLSAKKFYTEELGLTNLKTKTYRGLEHSSCPEEIEDVITFLKSVFDSN